MGELSPQFARVLNRQGRMHLAWWKEYAYGKCYRALQIREQILGPNHPDRAESLEDLGFHAHNLLDFVTSEQLLNQAIAIRRETQGDDHPELAEAYSLLAHCLFERGDMAQSYVRHRQALRLCEQARGRDHRLTARYRMHFAMQYQANADYAGSQRLLQESLRSLERQGLQGHPDYAGILAERGACLSWELWRSPAPSQAHIDECFEFFDEALRRLRETPGGTRLPAYAARLAGTRRYGLCRQLPTPQFRGNRQAAHRSAAGHVADRWRVPPLLRGFLCGSRHMVTVAG